MVLRRLLSLVDTVPPDRAVTAHWSAADTVAHLATITAVNVALLGGGGPDLPVPGLNELRAATTVDTIAEMNRQILGRFTERSIPVLAARMRADVQQLLAIAEHIDPLREVSWIGGARMPVAGLLSHLLNELNIHAWDIAQAVDVPWHIDPVDAALFVDVFLAGVTRCGYGRLLDHDRRVRKGRISVTFQPDTGGRLTFALVDGVVVLEPVDPWPDVRLRYDPATFNLMLFGRVSRVWAVLRRKVSVSGRRPWLLPTFMATMRLPS
ncbi:DinB family protein [Micromonospora sp. LOL_023]|uniref:DinB family protein n=1 Tax=Micromonospora sp. LOL_023 TaxID=3345418 RepID=UPI003A871569